ncbi:BQ5605_C006g04093 [Microbotryum silenes-dioicae]|uniref:BQ5605_C006g04093 protein n=1 Tax=Microbotryum silenes-dioicae TaxID=796604 RepID=A0A2X0MA42_9BASI|nr:BQ5605_C006g04093 [Microbotryum silenes-dioicae]
MEHQYSPSFWCQPDGEGTEEARCARSLFLIPVARSKARALHARTINSNTGEGSSHRKALLIPSKLALASDACMHGLGIVINGYSAYFALPEGWMDLPQP